MLKENLRLEIKNQQIETSEEAAKVDMWYVLCVFISPIDKTINYRKGFFDVQSDAEEWIWLLNNRYKKLNIPYYVISNTTELFLGNIFDSDLLREI